MNQARYRLGRTFLLVSIVLTFAQAKSVASIELKLTDAHIDQRYTNGPFDITLRGTQGDSGAPFVMSFSANETVNHPGGYYDPGSGVSPTFIAFGLDLRTNATGFIEITGPGLTLPNSIVHELTLSGPVTFELYHPFYPDPSIMWGEPEYLMMATGSGVIDIMLIAHLDNGPPYYEIADLNYSLARSGNIGDGDNTAVPEPSTLLIWSLLGTAIVGSSSLVGLRQKCGRLKVRQS